MLWVLLVFRLLSTTAEEFFSPILTQISQDFYFPPRLAGGNSLSRNHSECCDATRTRRLSVHVFPAVTLLAWGNGAPDIFSSIAAVKGGQYELALGGQFGECFACCAAM